MSTKPLISVIMPVYNGEPYLRTSIESILSQTFGDFEFIVVDDGSTDNSLATIKSYGDRRVRLLESRHAGLTAALNRGLAVAAAPLIARMDADDIAMPERFAIQAAYVKTYPDVDILCSDASIIEETGRIVGEHRMDEMTKDRLYLSLLYIRRDKPIIHPSVMMRRFVLEELEGYRDYPNAEDHDLWLRAVGRFKFAAVNQKLLQYRIHSRGVSRSRRRMQITNGIMSTANHYALAKTGVDLFIERKRLFDQFRIEAERRIGSDVLEGQSAFSDARAKMRSGGILPGALAFSRAFWGHGLLAFPWRTNRELSRLSISLANEICDELASSRGGRCFQS